MIYVMILPHRLRSMNDVPNDLTDPHLDYGIDLLRIR